MYNNGQGVEQGQNQIFNNEIQMTQILQKGEDVSLTNIDTHCAEIKPELIQPDLPKSPEFIKYIEEIKPHIEKIGDRRDHVNVSFDETYKNLFQVDDARLRADALKYAVVPRLRVILNNSIALIKDIYGIDALSDSRISFFPQFRPKRDNELTNLYETAAASLGGKVDKKRWNGFNRKD
jgi:hypothetical protein